MEGLQTKIEEKIGNTPLRELTKVVRGLSLHARIFAKLEGENVGGSIKDRVAKAIIDEAENEGRLQAGGTIVEATSGNTGIGLSLIGRARGYRVVILMPENMSKERQDLLRSYGAEVVLTEAKLGMTGAVEQAKKWAAAHENTLLADQFRNPVCAKVHYDTTAREIERQTQGEVDIFVAGVGSGGTLTGIGRYLKEGYPKVKIVAVEPSESPLLSQGKAGPHGIQGIGANFVPEVLDRKIYDEVITVSTAEAIAMTKRLQTEEGTFVGISSGANAVAAIRLAKEKENLGKTIVTVFPDEGGRYASILQ